MSQDILRGSFAQQTELVVAILAGGSGTRFWPLSRRLNPKQFLNLAPSGLSLIQATEARLRGLGDKQSTVVVTSEDQSSLVEKHLPGSIVLSEPEPKNTAPALALAATVVMSKLGDVPMLALAADHLIQNEAALCEVFKTALNQAVSSDCLLTIGIPPTGPETGYGYIERGESISDGVHRVARFVEKPDKTTAETYLNSGKYYWNSGMFVWRPSVFLAEVGKYMPNLASGMGKISHLIQTGAKGEKIAAIFSSLQSESVDFGIMEKSERVSVVDGAGFTWSDIGSWSSWAQGMEGDVQGNVKKGNGMLVDCRGCVTWSSGKTIAAVGMEDVVIVESEDAILVCKKGESQRVREIVSELKESGRRELL